MLALGFALGTVRAIFFEPALGPTGAVLLELPLILAAAWPLAGFSTRRARLGPALPGRAAAALIWFLLFLAAEFALAHVLRGWSPTQTLGHFTTPPGALGLAGFSLAALFLLLAGRK